MSAVLISWALVAPQGSGAALQTLKAFHNIPIGILPRPVSGGAAPSASSDPTASLKRFERGEWNMFDVSPTPEDLDSFLKWLRMNAAAWASADGPANERRRRLLLATFVLHLLNTEEDPFLWLGGGVPSKALQDPGHWAVGGVSSSDEPLPATRLLQWTNRFLNAESPLMAERWWHLGAIALLEREHATEALAVESDAAHARFPAEDRFVLARAIAQEEVTWPQVRDGRVMVVDRALYKTIADLYRAASARESVKSEAEVRMGFFELRRGYSDLALLHFTQAGRPSEPAVAYWLLLFEGEALEKSGREAEAVTAYRGAFSEAPYAQSAALALAAALEKKHSAPEADLLTRRTLAKNPAAFDPWSIYTFPEIRFWPWLTAELYSACVLK